MNCLLEGKKNQTFLLFLLHNHTLKYQKKFDSMLNFLS